MGLDSVELVLAFEEAFGLAIEDAVAEKMRTPRDVIEFVWKHRGPGTRHLCLTRRAFHRVRERLIAVGAKRGDIRPATPLTHLFPEKDRGTLWARARGDISVSQWPELVLPKALRPVVAYAPIIVAAAVFFATGVLTRKFQILSVWSAIAAALLMAIISSLIGRMWARDFPGLSTVRDLAVLGATGSTATDSRDSEEFTRAEIAATVKAIVLEQLSVSEMQYDETKDFVHGLGMD